MSKPTFIAEAAVDTRQRSAKIGELMEQLNTLTEQAAKLAPFLRGKTAEDLEKDLLAAEELWNKTDPVIRELGLSVDYSAVIGTNMKRAEELRTMTEQLNAMSANSRSTTQHLEASMNRTKEAMRALFSEEVADSDEVGLQDLKEKEKQLDDKLKQVEGLEHKLRMIALNGGKMDEADVEFYKKKASKEA